MENLQSCVHIEEQFYTQGYEAGYGHGKLHGMFDGRALGREKGWELWEEVGYYEGVCLAWIPVLKAQHASPRFGLFPSNSECLR